MAARPNGSLRRLRVVTGAVLVGLIALAMLGDMLAGGWGVRADYQASPVLVGTLLGGLLLILGIEVGSRLPGGSLLPRKEPDDDDG